MRETEIDIGGLCGDEDSPEHERQERQQDRERDTRLSHPGRIRQDAYDGARRSQSVSNRIRKWTGENVKM